MAWVGLWLVNYDNVDLWLAGHNATLIAMIAGCRLYLLTYLRQFESFHIHIYCLWDKNCVNPVKTNNPSVAQDSLYWQSVCLEWLSTLLFHDYDILIFYASIQTVWSEVVMRPRCNACDAPRQSHGQPELGEPEMWILLNWIFTCSHIGHHNILAQGRASYFGFLRSSTHESIVLQCIEMLMC